MDKFKKDINIMHGKGEWVESQHPRDEEGKFVKKGEDVSSQVKQESETKQDVLRHLVETLKKVKSIKIKEIVSFIKSLNPINLKINDDEIVAEFDKFTADKNVFSIGNSDIEGYKYKLSNVDKLPSYIEGSEYQYSKIETGKKTRQHKGVKEWHYFSKEISTEKGTFDIVVNVRDKGKNKYIYEVSFKKKKT